MTGAQPSPPAPADEGWKQRTIEATDRVQRVVDVYLEMGLEVRTEALEPTSPRQPSIGVVGELEDKCRGCRAAACGSFVVVYTRERQEP